MSFDNRVLSPIGSYTISSINAVHSVRKIRKEEKKNRIQKKRLNKTAKMKMKLLLLMSQIKIRH